MKIQLFSIGPAIPKDIAFLETLAHNLWWCWHSEAIELFRRIDPYVWREMAHNPLSFLSRIPQARFHELAEDASFVRHLNEVKRHFESYLAEGPPPGGPGRSCVAYFSLEYGIHESVRLYSGGLGVLAGDHLKAASDLAVPLVGVGLLYRQGYFMQYLNDDGWQQERYPDNEIHHMPVTRACDANGENVRVSVPMPQGNVLADVWQLHVGRVPLYLLDTNIPQNPESMAGVTARLYGGDRRRRLEQELLLGIGGFRALLKLGYEPEVCHMNEGHAAFVNLGRIAHLVKDRGLDLDTVMQIVPRTTVFTTHTPVAAGNETFDIPLVTPYLEALQPSLGLSPQQVIAWQKPPSDASTNDLSMTRLGLRMAHSANGVSQLHGEVARRMWAHLWPGRPTDEIPIRHITNGIHIASWLSTDNESLFDRYLGPPWRTHPADKRILDNITQIPNEELWRSHMLGRSRLIRFARERMEKQFAARNATRATLAQARSVLNHDVLTIGFARRFATYKRATLLLREPERLKNLLLDKERRIQLIFAGKAHPADDHGKDLIRQLVHFARDPELRRRVVFLEDYDINTARYLVQGVDVWLNTPRRPQEASGTSGMKACVNGALHLSVLDGWWCEGYDSVGHENGWAIGAGDEYDDPEYQDFVESQALFNLLENEVVPSFYDCPHGDIPDRWLQMMKASIRMAFGFFSSHRMVREYEGRFYTTASQDYRDLMADGAAKARHLVAQQKRLTERWGAIRISSPVADHELSQRHVGDTIAISCEVYLGGLKPDEVNVEAYYGPVDATNNIVKTNVQTMAMTEDRGNGHYLYRSDIPCAATGRCGFSARVTPAGRDGFNHMPGLITWADGL